MTMPDTDEAEEETSADAAMEVEGDATPGSGPTSAAARDDTASVATAAAAGEDFAFLSAVFQQSLTCMCVCAVRLLCGRVRACVRAVCSVRARDFVHGSTADRIAPLPAHAVVLASSSIARAGRCTR